MKPLSCLAIGALIILTPSVCTSSTSHKVPEKVDPRQRVEGNTTFAFDLYKKLREQKGNLFFSPYSISTALALTFAGARGVTAKQMAGVLSFREDQDQLNGAFARLQTDLNAEQEKGDVQLTIANALWVEKNYSFLKDFLDLTDTHYSASLNRVDFINAFEQARTQINKWVEEKTNDKIRKLIPPGILNPLTRLVLTNAIYFKGNWAHPFEENATQEGPFRLTSDKSVTVPLMRKMTHFRYGENESMQLLELPYAGNNLSMLVLLPKQVDGLPALEATFNQPALASWLSLLKRREVRVFLPKFRITSAFGLAGTLASMGMPNAFTSRADFSGMTGTQELFISAIVHKAFVDVNEEGTEAAAATGVTMTLSAVDPTPQPEFRADHPFLFLILHNPSGSILFLGRVENPTL